MLAFLTPVALWLSKVATHPLVANILIPAVSNALTTFFENTARRMEESSAIRAAKVAKTAEDFREASRKLSDATRRK